MMIPPMNPPFPRLRIAPALAALLASLLVLFSVSSARANVPGAVAGAAPSPEHPWGTLMVAWCEAVPEGAVVHLGERALKEERWVRDEVLRRMDLCPQTIHLAWSGARLVVVVGGLRGAEVVLLEREATGRAPLHEIAAVTYADAFAPSLDADERLIALGTFETNVPVVEVPPHSSTPPPRHALHVRLLDPSTLRVVNARVFRGAHLLRPHQMAERAGHALKLLAGRLYVAVPDDDPRVVAARLPSLATEKERTFPVPTGLRTPFSSSIVLNRVGTQLLVGIEASYVLSPELQTVATHRTPIEAPVACDPATRRVLTSEGANGVLAGFRVQVVAPLEGQAPEAGRALVVLAHGRGVVVGKDPLAFRVVP